MNENKSKTVLYYENEFCGPHTMVLILERKILGNLKCINREMYTVPDVLQTYIIVTCDVGFF